MQYKPSTLLPSLRKAIIRSRAHFLQELQELSNPAHPASKLAAAFALGTVLSFIPIPILDSMLVGLVLAKFRQVNRTSIFIARLIWNDFLVFPLYGPGYRIGSAVVAPILTVDAELPGLGTAVTPLLRFLTGTLILAVIVTMLGYLGFLLGIKLYRVVGDKLSDRSLAGDS